MRRTATLALAAFLAATPVLAPALAHITLDQSEAPADSYVRLAIRVPHGCAGVATTGLRLAVPEGLTSVRPAPKPGWTLTTIPGEPAPGRGEHGAPASTVQEITWRAGSLPDNQYDEFLLMVKTPATPGQALWFSFIQECEGGAVTRWIERREAGQPIPRWPAYRLVLTPKP